MIELTPFERFQLKWAARRERLLRKIRWKQWLRGSSHLELSRRRLKGEIGTADSIALREAQRNTPGNDVLRKMVENRPASTVIYAGDESWD